MPLGRAICAVYDQGLPVVEIRQDHLQALLNELEQTQRDAQPPDDSATMGREPVGGWHERLRGAFKGGLDADGRWWIRHDALAVYGDAESYEEAKARLLEEIAEALDEWRTLRDA